MMDAIHVKTQIIWGGKEKKRLDSLTTFYSLMNLLCVYTMKCTKDRELCRTEFNSKCD